MRSSLSALILAALVVVAPAAALAQAPAPAPTDRTKATVFTAEMLATALSKLPADRPSGAARVFTLAPYNVNVEQRQPRAQGASQHDAQAEFFYVTSPTRNGANLSGQGIEGGVRQAFKKGDFMIVPSGVPHQFVDITAPVQLLQIYLPNATP
jgi:mannose-6-phosphate isomerase-like protein (cupin superfamily)